MTGDQQALSAFQNTTHEPVADPSNGTPSPTNTDTADSQSESGSAGSSDGPLAGLYEDIRAAATGLPDALLENSVTVPLEPPSGGFVTNGVPEGIPALPASVGNWKLAVKERESIIYSADGKAYDERWGNGGAIHRVRVNLNDGGVNRDDLYHRSSESLVGYTNGDRIRNASVDDTGPLLKVPGHSVGNNEGDFACLHGTEHKSESIYEAAVDLLLHLHVTPTPLSNYVPMEPDSGWELTKLTPRNAVWRAPAPEQLSRETVQISLAAGRVTLSAYDESDSLPDRLRSAVPTFSEETETITTAEEGCASTPATSAGCLLVREALEQSPERLIQESELPERDENSDN
jgi:hypothetical protein